MLRVCNERAAGPLSIKPILKHFFNNLIAISS
jgi:hypothetical protein